MKKIAILLIVILVVSVGFLSGCVNEESRFIGTWADQKGYNLVIFSDGTYTNEDITTTYSGTWELKDDKIVFTVQEVDLPFSYSFSNNGNTLTLVSLIKEEKSILTKQ